MIPLYLALLIDNTFTVDQRSQLVEAVEAWNYDFNGAIHLSPQVSELTPADLASDAIILMNVDSMCPFIPKADGVVLAWTNKVGGNRVWFIHDRIQPWAFGLVALHELGHVFGANDRDAPGLMFRHFDPNQYRCVDKQTAAEVGNWLGVKVRFCE